MEFKIGQTVRTNEGREGIVRYVGGLHIAAGDWLGLELSDGSGKNDGSVKGERYFDCKPGHGIFVREGAIVDILKQSAPIATSRASGTRTASAAGVRTRPSSGVTADIARKRQSLMSNGSATTAVSRLSTRSPTKSPIIPTSKPSSSTASSPQIGTSTTSVKASDVPSKPRSSTSVRSSLGLQSSNTRVSAHASRPSISTSSSSRLSTTTRTLNQSTRTAATGLRISQASKPNSTLRKTNDTSPASSVRNERSPRIPSPTIDEEIEDDTGDENLHGVERVLDQNDEGPEKEEHPRPEASSVEVAANSNRILSTSRSGAVSVDTRAAQQREIEQLKAKLRTIEKKREEDHENLKQVETLQSEKDRFQGIIQALQKKLRAYQQDLIEMRGKYEEAETRANAIPETSGEHESELELATLDKEMAEERAETYQMELEALKTKHEELELEAEVLREENAELTSTMSPEEKANAGWLQMERERERLRDALLKLRDMSQENESSLKAEIGELRSNLDDAEKTAGLYVETVEKLSCAEETNKHLMSQLEAIETNDEVVGAMEIQREQQTRSIEQLRNQIQDLEEHIQVTEELEIFHVDEEKRLHAHLDETEALLSESHRRNMEQDRIIEDLEYTLTKFRDVVLGLQSDIDEMRRSREISEIQASEMSSKSRAMMDLNLRLQNNAAKTQTKLIDTELSKVKAELESKHVEMLELFLPDTVMAEQQPILTLLCFSRIKSKASLVGKILGERLRERAHLSNGDEVFKTFDTMEHMKWISVTCQRFEKYMSSCDSQLFATCGSALIELEPVERTVNAWIEALRGDELAQHEDERLKRMQGLLTDLDEKLITDSMEAQSVQILTQMSMVETYTESLAIQLKTITNMVQSKLGAPKSEDEESLDFDKRMDLLATKARTIKYFSSKVVRQLDDNCKNSLCLGEAHLVLFEEAEQAARTLASCVRSIGINIAAQMSIIDVADVLSYTSIYQIMASSMHGISQSNGLQNEDPFAGMANKLSFLQSLVDDIQNKCSEPNNLMVYTTSAAPWIVRAKEIKNTKLISPEVQDEITCLERRNVELGSKIAERDRTIEEMDMRVQIAEKRFKESKEKDNKEKAFQEEIESLKSTKKVDDNTIAELCSNLTTAQQKAAEAQAVLETLRNNNNGEPLTATGTAAGISASTENIGIDESHLKQLQLEVNLLNAEIISLQAAIRYLRAENRTLQTPVAEVMTATMKNSWLDPNLNKRKPSSTNARKSKLEREGLDIWTDLIDVAKHVKPIRLSHPSATNNSKKNAPHPDRAPAHSWQPAAHTNRYLVLKHREELEKWEALRDDFVGRAQVIVSGTRSTKVRAKGRASRIGPNGLSKGLPGNDLGKVSSDSSAVGAVGIVEA